MTRPRVALAAVLLVGLASAVMIQSFSWNQTSHYDLTRALNDDRTTIDEYQANTGDKVFYKGHYYSARAPGLALFVLPFYDAQIVETAAGVEQTVNGGGKVQGISHQGDIVYVAVQFPAAGKAGFGGDRHDELQSGSPLAQAIDQRSRGIYFAETDGVDHYRRPGSLAGGYAPHALRESAQHLTARRRLGQPERTADRHAQTIAHVEMVHHR